jgi:hypothetical protein
MLRLSWAAVAPHWRISLGKHSACRPRTQREKSDSRIRASKRWLVREVCDVTGKIRAENQSISGVCYRARQLASTARQTARRAPSTLQPAVGCSAMAHKARVARTASSVDTKGPTLSLLVPPRSSVQLHSRRALAEQLAQRRARRLFKCRARASSRPLPRPQRLHVPCSEARAWAGGIGEAAQQTRSDRSRSRMSPRDRPAEACRAADAGCARPQTRAHARPRLLGHC